MVDVAVYVEFKAKALIKELSESFDIRKCGDLYQTLGDLLKLESETEFEKSGFVVPNGGPLPDPVADVITSLSEKAKVPPPQEGQKSAEAILKTRRETGDYRSNPGQVFRRVKVREDGICFLRKGFRRKWRLSAEEHLQYDQRKPH